MLGSHFSHSNKALQLQVDIRESRIKKFFFALRQELEFCVTWTYTTIFVSIRGRDRCVLGFDLALHSFGVIRDNTGCGKGALDWPAALVKLTSFMPQVSLYSFMAPRKSGFVAVPCIKKFLKKIRRTSYILTVIWKNRVRQAKCPKYKWYMDIIWRECWQVGLQNLDPKDT